MHPSEPPSGAYELLSTKLVPPQPRTSLTTRPRLLSRLNDGLSKKVTLISAPAGFGKTTLAGEWIAQRREHDELPSLAWVSLDEGDNDPVRFWRYVLTACRAYDGDAGETSLALLNRSPQPPFEALLTRFINEVARVPGRMVLALEDYHLITSRQIHETLVFFIDNAPATLHLLLLTRSDPPLPLARLRAYNELNELRAIDLRFTMEEVHNFLKTAVSFPLSKAAAARLAQRTEGWAAGLRLVALAVQRMAGQSEIEQYLEGFSGSHRPVLEYLVGDVFAAQSPDVQMFLLQTSFLDRLSAPLCDAITGREDSALVLEQIERANLFIVPLHKPDRDERGPSDTGRWYRYHALFAEAMQHHAHRELGRAALRELAQKAARWYEENRMLAEATEASLYAQDYALAATLIERIIAPRLVQNEFHTLRRWMAQLPEDVLRAHPAICMTFATAILFTSPRHLPETKRRLQLPLEISEAHWQQAHDEYRLGEVYAFHSLVDWLQGDFKDCFSRARQALNLLPDEDRQWRGISLIMLAVEALLNGKVHEARQAIEEALARCEAVQNIYGTLDSMLLLGEICYRQGALLQARQIFKKVLDRVENAPMSRDQASIRGIRATLGLGLLDLEGNNLEQAQNAVAGAVAASEQFPQEYMLADCPLVLIEVMVARDEHEQAQQRLESLLAQTGRRYLFRFPSPYRAHLAMARGDLATAERWAARDTPSEEDMWPLQRLQAGLVGARVKIAQDNAEAAIPQLKSWLEETQIERHTRGEIEISLVLAQAYNAAGDSQQAQKMLIHALEMGRPANHRRIFLDLGAALAPLLKEAIPSIEDDALAAYARALFYTYSQEQAAKPENAGGAEWLVEPLTEQELRVLSLLAAGLSNPQIGEELVISVNTVKTHVKNIYGKLGVSNRREASDAAQQLNLL